ncbi:ribonucleotide-diphosphate reductase subunit beta [Halothiobacillus neapolitanus]|uniref:Ribonucleoside-diphosphate reductase subunit beta n=1 Tax=Halothiobacillus neapolitanus (strain ATCC 23641 / DSM 15147 / CIP 104769 / NCIMB 8539 / c2) TaxID=555778 RepID=D0KZH2_HALNC|nr:ribonucleotide-diphosphate reductase subunit beta [Halothiobacillus neapolitanus]ACX95845.1 Ribonucleoside-diphosphate reductase [Halothiobacillus neapolitanus c2]TDN66156.1 ribonucleoside-diphosphate reductase beta chain [Halothiobacillus neapolitanus]
MLNWNELEAKSNPNAGMTPEMMSNMTSAMDDTTDVTQAVDSGDHASPHGQTGLEGIAQGAGRVDVSAKRIINATADVNQLLPMKYTWAWEKYLAGCNNHWMPTEVSMQADIALWKGRDGGLTADERAMIMRNLGFFATAESLVANNIVLAIYKQVTNPECRQYLLRQAFEEAVHTHTFQYIVESLGLAEGELFNMYREIPSITAKDEWALKYTKNLADGDFDTSTTKGAQDFLRDLVAFYVVFEGMWFYTGFAQILSLGRRNKMTGIAEQYQYIMRDESIHMNFGIDVINQIKIENPHLWTEDFKAEVTRMLKEAAELEIAYARDTMPHGLLGLNAEMCAEYLHFIANRRCNQIGLAELFPGATNPFPWMSEVIDLKKEKNFFETRVTDYQTGGALNW